MPYATHLLVHAVTVSLRCAVETKEVDIRRKSVVRLEKVMAHIKETKDESDWDVSTRQKGYDG
jgi:hypothetical protein